MPARNSGKQAIKVRSIASHFITGLPAQTTVRRADLFGIEAVLMWKLSGGESSVNLLREDKGECSALSLETSAGSLIKFINMQELNR